MPKPVPYLCPYCELPLTQNELAMRRCIYCDVRFDPTEFDLFSVKCYDCGVKWKVWCAHKPEEPHRCTDCV